MIKLRFPIFIKELILFGLTLGLGLYTAYHYSFYSGGLVGDGTLNFTATDLVLLIIFFGAIFFISRHKQIANFSFKLFLILIIFSGSQVVFGAFIPSPWDLALALIFTLIFSRGGNVLVHNIGIILGISGVGAVFGLSVSTEIGLILLVILSLYDIVAVYITKHMVAMARNMIQGGAIFGFLIPFEFKGFFYDRNQARAGIGENFMILGSGDVALPLIFISSLVKISLSSVIITALFSLAGLFLTHVLFMNQGQRRAMAALPPIATMTIIGYLISILI